MTSVQQVRTEQRDLTYAAEQEAKDYASQLNEKTIERMTNEYSTALNQTANSFDMSIKSVEEFRRENETYFHYTDDGMEIGKKQDGGVLPFSTLLSDKRLEFRQEGIPVAYVQYNKLHIENVEAVRRWSVGAADDGGYFDFISTQYGMGVKWREAEQVEETATQSVKRQKRKQEYRQLIDDDGIFEVVKV